MPTLPALTLGHISPMRTFWALFALEAFRNALRWPDTPGWQESTLRCFEYARG